MSIGIPIKLLHDSEGQIVTMELKTGEVYRGYLDEAEDNMNCHLTEVTLTARDGNVTHFKRAYVRGSHIRYFILPDMLKNAPMFTVPTTKKNETKPKVPKGGKKPQKK